MAKASAIYKRVTSNMGTIDDYFDSGSGWQFCGGDRILVLCACIIAEAILNCGNTED